MPEDAAEIQLASILDVVESPSERLAECST